MPRTENVIWTIGLFTRIGRDSAKCSECGKQISSVNGSKTGAEKHLDKHEIFKEKYKVALLKSATDEPPKKQPKITEFKSKVGGLNQNI
jgi:hypothetical protein